MANLRMLAAAFAAVAMLSPVCAFAQVQQPTDFSDVIRLGVGEVTRADGAIARDQVVLSFPFEYRRTGTLQNDVHGNGRFALGTLFAAAGSPGYLLGEFGTGGVGTPIWCFFNPGHVDIDHIICFFGGSQGISTVLDFAGPPLLVSSFEMRPDNNRTADGPIVEEGPVTLPFQQRAIFKFIAWHGQTAVLQFSNGERNLGRYYVTPNAAGETIFRTVAGSMRFSRNVQGQTIVQAVEGSARATTGANVASLLQASGALRIENALRALDSPEAHDFQAVARDQIVFAQRVAPASAQRQDTSPNNDRTNGEPGALLVPVMRGLHPMMCWRAYPYRYLTWSERMQADCLEDADGDGLYELIWPAVGFADTDSFFVYDLNAPAQRLRTPVHLTPATDEQLPQGVVSLKYLGPVRERRTATNELRVAAVGFRWMLGRAQDANVIEVEIGENGEGALAIAGSEVGRIRNIDLNTGAAEFMLESGLPVGALTFLSGRTQSAPTSIAERH